MDHNAAPYEQSRLYVTGCLDVDMVIESGAEPQFLTIYVKEGDADMISWVENITRIIVFERTADGVETPSSASSHTPMKTGKTAPASSTPKRDRSNGVGGRAPSGFKG